MPWGGDYKGGDGGIKDTKPPDAGGGLKSTKYDSGLTQDVKTGTGAAGTGAANICNAGMIYAPELEALFAWEL